MIKLYGFGPAFDLVDPSPFVTKVNLYMTLNNIEFESIADQKALFKAPKKKLPFIDDGGEIIADSTFIIDHLNKKHKLDIDSWLSTEQRGTAYMVNKSIEENLYWCLLHSRWINDDTWPTVRAAFFDDMPFPMNKLIAHFARSGTKKRIMGHGMGSHSEKEVLDITQRSLQSLSDMLGDKPYFFGDQISSLDISAFSFVGGFTLSSIDNDGSRLAKSYGNLVSLTQKIKAEYYPQT